MATKIQGYSGKFAGPWLTYSYIIKKYNFAVIPLRYSSTSSSQHYLFVKEYSDRSQSSNKPEGHTLLVLNIPPYATEDNIMKVFSCVGSIRDVTFEQRTNMKSVETCSFKWGYIIYENPSSVFKALKLTALEPLTNFSSSDDLVGLQKWVRNYNSSFYNHKTLQHNVDLFMRKYDKEVEKKKREKNVDDNGWTVVSKKGRTPGLSRKESVENKIINNVNKGMQKKQLTNFYTFQKRESKMNHIVEMRKKYEEDKKKVNAMKQARKFRPY